MRQSCRQQQPLSHTSYAPSGSSCTAYPPSPSLSQPFHPPSTTHSNPPHTPVPPTPTHHPSPKPVSYLFVQPVGVLHARHRVGQALHGGGDGDDLLDSGAQPLSAPGGRRVCSTVRGSGSGRSGQSQLNRDWWIRRLTTRRDSGDPFPLMITPSPTIPLPRQLPNSPQTQASQIPHL